MDRLVAGPDPAERSRGLINFTPPGAPRTRHTGTEPGRRVPPAPLERPTPPPSANSSAPPLTPPACRTAPGPGTHGSGSTTRRAENPSRKGARPPDARRTMPTVAMAVPASCVRRARSFRSTAARRAVNTAWPWRTREADPGGSSHGLPRLRRRRARRPRRAPPRPGPPAGGVRPPPRHRPGRTGRGGSRGRWRSRTDHRPAVRAALAELRGRWPGKDVNPPDGKGG